MFQSRRLLEECRTFVRARERQDGRGERGARRLRDGDGDGAGGAGGAAGMGRDAA